MTRTDDDAFVARLREEALGDVPESSLDPRAVLAASRRKRRVVLGVQAGAALVSVGLAVGGVSALSDRWDRTAPPVDQAPFPEPAPTASPSPEPDPTMCAEFPPQPPPSMPSYEGWWSSSPAAVDGSILLDPALWPPIMREHPQTVLVDTVTRMVIESFDRYACGPVADYVVPVGLVLPPDAVVVVLDAVTGEILETIPSEGPFTLAPASDEVTQSDLELVERFVIFALDPSEVTAADLDLAPEGLRIGLADRLLADLPLRSVADPAAWEIDAEMFRARGGTFSALAVLQGSVAGVQEVDGGPFLYPDRGSLVVTVGAHPGCSTPPPLPPPDVAGLRQVSVQPGAGAYGSCVDWFVIDLFVRDDGTIAAITLDFGEPRSDAERSCLPFASVLWVGWPLAALSVVTGYVVPAGIELPPDAVVVLDAGTGDYLDLKANLP